MTEHIDRKNVLFFKGYNQLDKSNEYRTSAISSMLTATALHFILDVLRRRGQRKHEDILEGIYRNSV